MAASMAESSQSQQASDSSLQIQAGGNVTITLGVSYAELDQKISEARREIAQEVLSKAQEMLRLVGVQPEPVPIKTLVPLLQYASLEDDQELQERWARLLASAANPRNSVTVLPAFPDILRQLDAKDAVFLDGIYERFCSLCAVSSPSVGWVGTVDLGTYQDLREIWDGLASDTMMGGDAHSEALVPLENILRLNLITRRPVRRRDDVAAATSAKDFEFSAIDHYSLTALGFVFLNACKMPERGKDQ
jgi:hypothetical protein